jgi:hypothetical protein
LTQQNQDDDQAKAEEARLAADEATDEDDFGETEVVEAKEPAAVAVAAPRRGTRREKGPSRRTVSREDRRRRSASRKTRRRTLYGLGGGSIALMLIAGLFLPNVGLGNTGTTDNGSGSVTSQGDLPSVGTPFAIQAASVIEAGAAHAAYSSNPPTSGPRYEEGIEWGVHAESQADEAVVRNLEQGGVVVNYNLTDQVQIDDLTSYLESQPGYPGCFIMQPYESVAAGSVTLTSWGWSESYTGVDQLSMEAFVEDHRNDGPLFLGNTCGADTTIEAAAPVDPDV